MCCVYVVVFLAKTFGAWEFQSQLRPAMISQGISRTLERIIPPFMVHLCLKVIFVIFWHFYEMHVTGRRVFHQTDVPSALPENQKNQKLLLAKHIFTHEKFALAGAHADS